VHPQRRGLSQGADQRALPGRDLRDDIRVEGGILAEECARLYYGPDDNPPREEQTNL
jgi:tRNA(adenine34) deaminase